MRLTIPHYFDFGADRDRVGGRLDDPIRWDAVRDTTGPFGLSADRAEWEARSTDPETAARAHDIAARAREERAGHICSYGVGTGGLELALSREAPDIELTCTDFAPRAVERLRTLFPEATVVQHDLLADAPLAAELHVLHRVDTEFSDEELRDILARFREPVLLVPAAFLSWRLFLRELALRLTRRGVTRAGWLRNEAAFRTIWGEGVDVREVPVGGGRGFVLTRKRPTP